MGGELGVDAGAQARDGLGAVALDVELVGELAVEGLDGLTEVGEQPRPRRVLRVGAGWRGAGVSRCRSLRLGEERLAAAALI